MHFGFADRFVILCPLAAVAISAVIDLAGSERVVTVGLEMRVQQLVVRDTGTPVLFV